jgi:hypothetical protein
MSESLYKDTLIVYGPLIPIWENFTDAEREKVMRISGFKKWQYYRPEPPEIGDLTRDTGENK